MEALKLIENRHPDKFARQRFDALIGIDEHKSELVLALAHILNPKMMNEWMGNYYPKGLPHIKDILSTDPLVILSGDVGCGKTELAQCIATPVSENMGGETVILFETPSNIRGTGFVGELSSRITAAFTAARMGLKKNEYGILLIDEADDLATSRDQLQAHHEDRSGVNVLIKEIDKIHRDGIKLAVILITNRPKALDPAVVRRAAIHLQFQRPNSEIVKELFGHLFKGAGLKNEDFDKIAAACESKEIPFSYSDIVKKVTKQTVLSAWRSNNPITSEGILDVVEKVQPSPLITETHKI